ncbi:MAG: hypothetical protein K2O53_06010, partial [Bacteroidales bacterium]|nr:hypothetical protein [Bacteroidales bacterium]
TIRNFIMEEQTNNEIDLLDLVVTCFKAIGRGIAVAVKGIGIALAACFGFCVRHFFWLLGGVASGLILIFLCTTLSKRNYVTGEAMLSCYGTSLSNIENEVYKLNQMLQSEKTSLSFAQSKLGLSPELARSLKSITFGYGMDIDNDTIADYVEYTPGKAKNIYLEKTLKGGANGDKIVKTPIQQKVSNIFYLKIETNLEDIQDFHTMGQAICDYLNHLPTLQTILELQRFSWEARIEEIDRQKTLLDSMLRIEYFENSRQKAASYGQGAEKLVLADPKQIGIPFDYKDIIALTDQKTALQTLLAQTQQMVNIVSNFQPTSAVTHTQKIWAGLIWMGLFVVIALICDYRKPIGQYIKEQRQR